MRPAATMNRLEPAPVACDSCTAFAAEHRVTLDDGTAWLLCHLCAHAVTEHAASPETAWRHLDRCECDSAHIYPQDVEEVLGALRSAHLDAMRDAVDKSICTG